MSNHTNHLLTDEGRTDLMDCYATMRLIDLPEALAKGDVGELGDVLAVLADFEGVLFADLVARFHLPV